MLDHKKIMEKAMTRWPQLTFHGNGIMKHGVRHFDGPIFEADRALLLKDESLISLQYALDFIDGNAYFYGTSYHLKAETERYAVNHLGHPKPHVSSGVFTAAATHRKLEMRPLRGADSFEILKRIKRG